MIEVTVYGDAEAIRVSQAAQASILARQIMALETGLHELCPIPLSTQLSYCVTPPAFAGIEEAVSSVGPSATVPGEWLMHSGFLLAEVVIHADNAERVVATIEEDQDNDGSLRSYAGWTRDDDLVQRLLTLITRILHISGYYALSKVREAISEGGFPLADDSSGSTSRTTST